MTPKDFATGVAALLLATGLAACGDGGGDAGGSTDPGVDVDTLSPVIDNPYVAYAQVSRAVFEGTEVDEDTGEAVSIRVVSEPSGDTTIVGGAQAAIVEVTDSEDGTVVERTDDYYAQGTDGVVFYMGESVDDIENGVVVGHEGQWEAGVEGARAGVFMPADPAVGDVFEQERAPGVAEDRSTVLRTGLVVRVPAGTFDNCIKTEDLDPISEVTELKFYCPDIGLVREKYPVGGSLNLVKFAIH
jgi:hypothetical protein